MASALEDLPVLQAADAIADGVWTVTTRWNSYARNVMGQQLCRAVDSIGANIAEAFGRYHFGEKIRFLYYARGSLFETKYWLNRAHSRKLISDEANRDYARRLNDLGRQLNQFVNQLKAQQKAKKRGNKDLREPSQPYQTKKERLEDDFIDGEELDWLTRPRPSNDQPPIPNLQSPISCQ